MRRNILLSAFAAATLAGCATGYSYRNGNGGDYYYGQPRIEYRYYGNYGYGSYGPGYYYDRYGRLVYGDPYAYYGSPYGYGYPYFYGSRWGHRPRPQHDHDNEHGDGHDGDGNERRPPWRNIGAFPRDERVVPDREEARPRARRQQLPTAMPMPAPQQRAQRPITRSVPSMRSDDGGGSRMGRTVRNAKAASAADE